MNAATNPSQTVNNWLRLGIPCCLGALAGVFNYLTVDGRLTPTQFCVITERVPAGGIISADAIASCEITGGANFMKFAVPYSQVKGFIGSRASHKIDRNSLLLWQHLDNHAPYPVERDEIEVGFTSNGLQGVDLPEQMFAGDRLLLQVADGDKFHELGPFVASKVAYSVDDDGESAIDELRLIVRKRTRQLREVMGLKHGGDLRLVHIGRAG